MFNVMVVVLVERALSTLVAMAPFVLCGVVLAAAAEVLVGPRLLRGAFAEADGRYPETARNTRWKVALRGTAWGLLLPTCAVGAVPLAVVLWRSGVRGRGLLALILASAASNPFAALALANQIELVRAAVILGSVLAKIFLIAVLAPALNGESGPQRETGRLEERAHPSAVVRLLLVAGGLVRGPTLLAVVLTVVAACLMAVFVPPGFIGHLFCMDEGGDPAEYLARGIAYDHLLLALPAAFFSYVPPDLAATQAAAVAHLRALPGAAALWILVGAAAGPALVVSLGLGGGMGRLAAVVGLVLLGGFVAAVATHIPLQDRTPIPEDTHAFDRHTRPYRGNWNDAPLLTSLSLVTGWTLGGPGVLAAIALGGLWVCSRLGHRLPRMDVHGLPVPLLERASGVHRLTVAGVAGVALVVTGAYVVYPAPSLTVEQMRDPDALVAIAIRQNNLQAAEAPMARLEVLAGRIGPGGLLRPLGRPANHRELSRAVERAVRELGEGLRGGSADLQSRSIALTFALRDVYAAWESAGGAERAGASAGR